MRGIINLFKELLARTTVNAGHVTTPRNNTKRTHHLVCPLCVSNLKF